MTRAQLDYGAQTATVQPSAGMSIETPRAGFYRARLRSGGAYVGVYIWHGAPLDPVTGEELDRSPRWQASVNGAPIDIDDAWPRLAQLEITAAEYRALTKQQQWAQEHAPDTALADPRRPHDPLTSSIKFF